MKRSRRTFLFSLVAIATSAGTLYYFGARGGLPDAVTAIYEPDAIKLTVANSVTKQKWLEAAATNFATTDIRTASGKKIAIEITPVLSGDSLQQILAGNLKPVVWSPGEKNWVDQLNDGWKASHAVPAMSTNCAPTIYSPSGFAIWRPMAEALGWPNTKIGWKTIIDLVNNPQGWASKGHPEWGKLKLGHTHPAYSSAGLLFMASAIYGILGKTTDITVADVYDPKVEAALRALAKNTTKYGMVTTDLLNRMAQDGPDFLHVVSAFEEGTVRFNVEKKDQLRWPLVFIFPAEGTFWSDHPWCVLDGTDWVTPEQAEAAKLFHDYLLSTGQQQQAAAYYLRPVDQALALGDALSVANGTDPAANPTTIPPLTIPDAAVSKAIIDQFLVTKRKATILLALDVSGSMTGEGIRTATEATAAFLQRLDPSDRVGLITFNEHVYTVSDIKPFSETGETLSRTVLGLVASGGTNLYGAVCNGTHILDDVRRADVDSGDARVYGLVVLSDGQDTTGAVSENRMMETCLRHGPESQGARLFTIAFGADSDPAILQQMASVTGGTMFKADPKSIDAVYLKISAEQ